jgi:hypothetical protein
MIFLIYKLKYAYQMDKKIYKFSEYFKVNEAEENEENLDTENEETTENEEEGTEDEDEDEEEPVDPEEDIKYDENPSYYINQRLNQIENKIMNMFAEPEDNDKSDMTKYYNQGVELLDVKRTRMPMSKTLIVKYQDSNFIYHLLFTVKLEQAQPTGDEAMSTDEIDFCGVKFKKYNLENTLLGEIDRKKVEIKNINQDFIDSLNGEIDDKYSLDDGFEIEYEKE